MIFISYIVKKALTLLYYTTYLVFKQKHIYVTTTCKIDLWGISVGVKVKVLRILRNRALVEEVYR